jgi:DNA-directed RNA polymerase specialized sigma24 family protein
MKSTLAERERFWCAQLRQYRNPVRQYLRRIPCTDDDRLEIEADLWALVVEHEDEIRAFADGWFVIRQALRSIAAERLRIWRHESVVDLNHPDQTAAPEPDNRCSNDLELCTWLNAVLGMLPEKQRWVLDFRYRWGFNDQHIAEVLGIASNSVRVYAMRGLKRLRTIVDAHPPPTQFI